MFGYTIPIVLFLLLFMWLIDRKAFAVKNGLVIVFIALMTVSPYLFYTYQLTHRFFYWGNSGGQTLYWMSNPFEGEFGEWHPETLFTPEIPCDAELFKLHHQKDFFEISSLLGVAKDDALKRMAMANIKKHPIKFVKNIIANVGRLFFGFPWSNYYQNLQALYRIPPNAIMLTLIVFCFIPTFLFWKKLNPAIRFIFIFSFVYLCSSSVVSAFPRQFYIIVPCLLIWIGYIFENILIFNVRFGNKSRNLSN
jgi:hypothetical protein